MRIFFYVIIIFANFALAKNGNNIDLESLGLDNLNQEAEEVSDKNQKPDQGQSSLQRLLIDDKEKIDGEEVSDNQEKIDNNKDYDKITSEDSGNSSFTDNIKNSFSKIGGFFSNNSPKIAKDIKNKAQEINVKDVKNKVVSKIDNIVNKKEEEYNNEDVKTVIENASNVIFFDDDLVSEEPVFDKGYPKPVPKNPPDFLTTDIPPPLLAAGFSDENIHHPILTGYFNKVTLLFNEIGTNDINEFNALLRQIYNINIYNDFGDTPLLFATSLKRRTIVASLLAAGANPDLKNKLGQNAVNIAIKMGDYEMLKMLVESGANLDIRNNFGETYLIQAVRTGYLPIIDYLADDKVDLNASDKNNQTAFDIARNTGNNVVMQLLLRYGAEKQIIVKRSIINELNGKWE
ncbi:ankyrin repeat domain-containing protein [Rickettsiales bacterium]|nr:ankyrin repeat domain-containing protein [Rickettsiales bacterium]